MRIIMIEDDLGIGHVMKKLLEKRYDEVVWVQSAEALFSLEAIERFDIALIDVMLGGVSGFEALKWLRQRHALIGAIMLTAKSANEDKIRGLTDGADDYVTKPFNTQELLARIEALYRKVAILKENVPKGDPLLILGLDQDAGIIQWQGKAIDLTQTEVAIVACLMGHIDHVVSRDALLDAVWGSHYYGNAKIVDVNVQRIRKKLSDDAILTKWGRGYQWNGSV